MRPRLKKLDEQTMVITGASSGIGLATARMAADRGARVVLAARNEDALQRIVEEIADRGGKPVYVVADVGREEDARKIAAAATEHFGGFDTWFNNAGIAIYGDLQQTSEEDHRRLFDTNYWGIVNGSRVAVEHLRERGGALINMGSVASDRAIPLQGAYSASKHAVKGFTNALRMELEAAGAPVSVTLIKPGSIDTPYVHHARNYMAQEPKLPPPLYAPDVVAEAVLYAAENPVRAVVVGGAGKMISAMGRYMPRVSEWLMARMLTGGQQQNPDRPNDGRDSLYAPIEDGDERSGERGLVLRHSLYTRARMHPALTAAVAVGLVGGAVAALRGRRAL